MLGSDATKEEIDALRSELGLDKPVLIQYGNWLLNVLHGDLGKSIMYREDVVGLIKRRLPITLYLGALALILTAVFGTTAGIICAVRRGTLLDSVVTVLANMGIAVPIFWLGILGIYVFSIKLGLVACARLHLSIYGFLVKHQESVDAGPLPNRNPSGIRCASGTIIHARGDPARLYKNSLVKGFEGKGYHCETRPEKTPLFLLSPCWECRHDMSSGVPYSSRPYSISREWAG